MKTLRLPTSQFRAMTAPNGKSRVGFFYCPAGNVPRELWEWREVNPREVNKRSGVYRNISETLRHEPERFHERNRGMTIVADSIEYDDKRKEVLLRLSDAKLHGVVDGAHTLSAIVDAQQERETSGGEWPAHVFIKALSDVDVDQIAEIAGGLNRSEQVDLKSLENLRDHFDRLKKILRSEPYADKIAYKMNEAKEIDVREVLYYLAVFDADTYSEQKHPVGLFGRKEGIVREFARQAEDSSGQRTGGTFDILISKAPEILRLRDLLEKSALEIKSEDIGRYKAGTKERVRSATNRENPLHFLNETVNGKIPLGWIMPILAGFRANVEWNKPKGSFSWTVPIDDLVKNTIEQLVLNIIDVHKQENSRPEFVGRNSIAWRMSYNTVSQAILRWRLDKKNA